MFKKVGFILAVQLLVAQPFYGSERLVRFDAEHSFFSEKNPVVSVVSGGKRDKEVARALLALIDSDIKEEQEREIALGEALTKVVAYRDWKCGEKIVLPSEDGKGGAVTYQVERIFYLFGGMPAYGLSPLSGKSAPILLYRGSCFSFKQRRALASIASDLDLTGPGHLTYLHARKEIRAWLKTHALKGCPARVMGFSLGAALAAYTVLYEGDLLSKSARSLAFNSPGMARLRSLQFNGSPHAHLLSSYINEGDIISKVWTSYGYPHQFSHRARKGPIESHLRLASAAFAR